MVRRLDLIGPAESRDTPGTHPEGTLSDPGRSPVPDPDPCPYGPSMERVTRMARLAAVTTVGVALLVTGIAMLVLPGPGLLVVLAGLAVLSLEYAWARRLRDEARFRVRRLRDIRRAQRLQPAVSAVRPNAPESLAPDPTSRAA